MLKNYVWILPFICFAGGYFIARSFVSVGQFSAPAIEGKSLYEAATTLSNYQLTLSILRIKQDSDLTHGTIIRQVPAAGQMVKPRQTVFVTISEQPPAQKAPHMLQKTFNDIESELHAQGIRYKIYFLDSPYPKDTCIAQWPEAGEPLTHGALILYCAQPHHNPAILPNVVGMPVQDAIDLLKRYNREASIISPKRKSGRQPIVIDQRPLAGSLISRDDSHDQIIQLHVQ